MDLDRGNIMNKVVELLKEPSTYAGFAGLALTLGVSVDEYTAYTTALAAVFSLVAVALSEKK